MVWWKTIKNKPHTTRLFGNVCVVNVAVRHVFIYSSLALISNART